MIFYNRVLKKGQKVTVISGAFKNKKYNIQKFLRNGYLYLENLVGLNSSRKVYSLKIHHCKVKPVKS
jgi:hypothetical protein